MDINFPLIMVVLVFGGAAVWLFDAVLLAPKRRAAVAALQGQSTATADIQQAESALLREPVLVEYAKSFTPVLAIVLVLRSFLFEPFQIPSSSMVPTLQVGDFILVNKYTYGLRLPVLRNKFIEVGEPERGDVMVFFPPHKPNTYYIKRVIGLPGDRLEYRNKQLYVNGEPATQTVQAALAVEPGYRLYTENLVGVSHQIRTRTQAGMFDNFSVTVQPGHYFMMGDNRDNSSDSRVWGQVPESAIVGKAVAIWMHWDDFFSLPSFGRVGGIQ